MLRNLFLKKLVMILLLLPPGQNTKTRPMPNGGEPVPKRLEHIAQRHEIEMAVENISENIPVLKKILAELDDAETALWRIHTADKIPSQAVAVIELMAATNIDPDCMCPRRFFEGERRFVIEAWMNKAVSALESFTMKEPRKERIRRECLERITRARHGRAVVARARTARRIPTGRSQAQFTDAAGSRRLRRTRHRPGGGTPRLKEICRKKTEFCSGKRR